MFQGELNFRYVAFAYEPEGQAIAVAQLQRDNILSRDIITYQGRYSQIEEGVSWYFFKKLYTKFLTADCSPKLMRRLRIGQKLIKISGGPCRPDIGFGRPESVIAALLDLKDRPIYRSPGFDLENYLATHRLPIG